MAVGYSRAQLNQFPASLLLRAELSILSYRCSPIALGHNTDPHQHIEREWKITRQIPGVLAEYKHPVSIINKSALVERVIDLLTKLVKGDLVRVFVSVNTLDAELTCKMEPRAATPRRRLQTVQALNGVGARMIPNSVRTFATRICAPICWNCVSVLNAGGWVSTLSIGRSQRDYANLLRDTGR